MPVYFTDRRKGLVLISKDIAESSMLIHYGIKGQKWGERRWQNEDGSLTPEGYVHYGYGKNREKAQYNKTDTVFVSGKVKYDKPLSRKMKREIKNIIKANGKIVIGDAPGADTRVQEYLKKKNYQNVEVFTTDREARNNVGGWKVNKIDASEYSDEREARAQKDIAMTKIANKGVAITSEDDRPDSATAKNIQRMREQGSQIKVYDYKTKKFLSDNYEESLNKKISEYKEKEKNAGIIGDEAGKKRVSELESMPDGPEKGKAIESILEESDNASSQRAENFQRYQQEGFSFNECHAIQNAVDMMNPKSYELTHVENWLSGQITEKSGDWYNTEGVSEGFKKITDEIHDLRLESMNIYEDIYRGANSKNLKALSTKYEKDPRIVQMNKRIDELTEQMPEQVLRDLNVPVTKENLERIRPFVFWD